LEPVLSSVPGLIPAQFADIQTETPSILQMASTLNDGHQEATTVEKTPTADAGEDDW
jgi:hypothetical protein